MSGVAINILFSDILFFIACPCAVFTNNSRSKLLRPLGFFIYGSFVFYIFSNRSTSVTNRFGADRRRAVCRRAAVRVVRLVLIFPKSRVGKNTRKMTLLRNRGAEMRAYENRAYQAGKDHRYMV